MQRTFFNLPFQRLLQVLFLTFYASISIAQPHRSLIEVVATPVEMDWTYELHERADFHIKILRNGQTLSGTKIAYEIGPEQMPPLKEGELLLEKGQTTLEGIKLDKPGFVRCHVTTEWNGRTYSGWGTAAYAPDQINPVVNLPDDFDEFWSKCKDELAAIPINAIMTPMPAYATPDIEVYHVSMQNIALSSWQGASRFYGMLSVPKSSGKFPAILVVPGAGVRPYYRDDRASRGVIVFQVGIHGLPVNLDREVYNDLARGALSNYPINKLDDLDQYYYKRVYLGCVRAIDFIFSMDKFDGENLAVTGGSQGGALTIVTAGLDNRVTCLASFYPALCDMTAYLEDRAGGWPHMFRNYNPDDKPKWKEVAPYYDVVNFARVLKAPGWYSWGYNDNVCPPTSMHAAYNSISVPKELHIFHETGHWTFPEQREEANTWIYEKLKID